MALTPIVTTDSVSASVVNAKIVTPANAHIDSTSNPHGVTKAQVGLSNVTNDAQIPKSIIDSAGDLIYGMADNTPAKLAKGTARQQLAMNSGATAPEWVASLQSLISASGDLIYGSAANTPARLAKGTDGQALVLNGGLPSWGSVIPFELITEVLMSGKSTISLTAIPSKYTKLILVAEDYRHGQGGGTLYNIDITVNGITTGTPYTIVNDHPTRSNSISLTDGLFGFDSLATYSGCFWAEFTNLNKSGQYLSVYYANYIPGYTPANGFYEKKYGIGMDGKITTIEINFPVAISDSNGRVSKLRLYGIQ